jgi:hypothetical protein
MQNAERTSQQTLDEYRGEFHPILRGALGLNSEF